MASDNIVVVDGGNMQNIGGRFGGYLGTYGLTTYEGLAVLAKPENDSIIREAAAKIAALASGKKSAVATPAPKNHYRSLMEVFTLPALIRPTLTELVKYGVREIIEDTSPEDEVRLDLGTVLREGESLINGDTYTARVEPLKGVTLGLQHAIWIAENPDKIPAWLAALRGKVYIDFRGLLILNADGDRSFPCLSDAGERWTGHWDWAGRILDAHGRVAVSGK